MASLTFDTTTQHLRGAQHGYHTMVISQTGGLAPDTLVPQPPILSAGSGAAIGNSQSARIPQEMLPTVAG
jgi:hypothetical protein